MAKAVDNWLPDTTGWLQSGLSFGRHIEGANINRCNTNVCSSCLRPCHACLCDIRLSLDVAASFWLVMHHNEQFKPTNTGRLLLDSVGGGRTIWQRTVPDFRLLHLLARADRYPILVYPQTMAPWNPVVSRAAVADSQRAGVEPVFVLLDGTWQQSRKIYNHSPYLHTLPMLSIAPSAPSRYRLRRAQQSEHLCTAEVGAQCLAWLGEQQAAQLVDDYFDVFNERYRSAKQARKSSDPSPAMIRLQAALNEIAE